MIWVVIAENPWPDDYIPVFIKQKVDAHEMVQTFGSIRLFDNEKAALKEAKVLKEQYSVNNIRIFYPEGYSKNSTL